MIRIQALPAKKVPAEYFTEDANRAKYYWNETHNKPWSRAWWLDWSGKQPVLCDAKGQVKKSGWVDIHRYLSTYNRNGYGIYLQPNPSLLGESGQGAALPGRAIFTESDGAIPANNAESTAVTRELTAQAQALSPDLVVTTFKSAHTYRIGSALYPSVGAWQVDQARFTQKAREIWGNETDESLTDANQLMRLAGFNHARWQDERMQYQPVRIAYYSGKTHADIDTDLPDLEAPIASKTVGVAHDFSPLELISFAHLLEGYKVGGRKGHDTCKCPAHNGEANDSLHFNQKTAGYICHAGCTTNAIYQAALEIAIAKGYELPARQSSKKEHWDYDEPYSGIWGDLAERFGELIEFPDGAPELIALLPQGMRSKVLNAKTISSPQAIALKTYTLFLSPAGHPEYEEEAKDLIGDTWSWDDIPTRTPLWGWKGFLSNVSSYSSRETKKKFKTCRDDIHLEEKALKAAEIRALAEQWEAFPENVSWLDTQYFGPAILEKIKAAGSERSSLGVFGATGTGKTYALKAVRDWAKAQGRQLIYISVKESNTRSAGRDLGLDYRLDVESSNENRYPDVAACAAALIENARGINWERQVSPDAIVIIDEFDLFASVMAGTASGNNSLELQRVFAKLGQTGQTFVYLSAQLKKRHRQLMERLTCCDRSEMIGIRKAAVPKKIILCDDTARPDSETEVEGTDYEASPAPSFKNLLLDRIKAESLKGENLLIMTSAQLPDSKLGTMLIERFLLEECGVSSTLRLDSQSNKDPAHPAFKIAEKDYIEAMRAVQCVIPSPSLQEGFSLKFGPGAGDSHFHAAFIFDSGGTLPEQTIQQVGRDRHDTKTWVCIAPGHTRKTFGGTTAPAEVRRQLQAMAQQKEVKLLDIANSSSPLRWDSAYFSFYCEDVAQANASDRGQGLEPRALFQSGWPRGRSSDCTARYVGNRHQRRIL